jgi:transcriptional regulator of arginine metabolism
MQNYCIIMSTARKTERQQAIVEIIRERQISTQSELVDALGERGVEADQGTVSRDIRELGLVKAAGEDGEYHYALVDDISPAQRAARISVLRQLVKAAIPSGNLVVVRCGPGNAPAVGEALDHFGIREIIGTVAGDDTLLVVVAEGASSKKVADRIMKEIRGE